jgi:hypothetical protein
MKTPILSSLFDNLGNACNKTLVCNNRSELNRETVPLTRIVDARIEFVQCLGTSPQTCSFVALSNSQRYKHRRSRYKP